MSLTSEDEITVRTCIPLFASGANITRDIIAASHTIIITINNINISTTFIPPQYYNQWSTHHRNPHSDTFTYLPPQSTLSIQAP